VVTTVISENASLEHVPGSTTAWQKKTTVFVLSVLLGGLSIWAANSLFARKLPTVTQETPGLTVSHNTVSLDPAAPQWRVLKIAVATSASTHTTDPLPARIRIDESKASRVGSPLSGRVGGVLVELGQKVKVGTPLFTVTSPELSVLKAERDKAELSLAASRTALERVRAMVAAKAIPAKEEIAAQQEYRQAEVAHRLALSKLAALRVTSRSANEFTVVSRRDGVVVEKNLLPAQEVAQETDKPLLLIADLSTVWAVVDLNESDAMQIQKGAMAVVTSPSLPGLSVRGRVEMVSSVVDPDRHTLPIRVQLDNTDGTLKPNMYAQVQFEIPPGAETVEVAATALISDGDHQFIFVQGGQGQFSRRPVTAGSAHSGRVPIFSGLKAGESVVEEGGILLDNQLSLSR
jgi:membrane fusion protein, heavy metal efflux system